MAKVKVETSTGFTMDVDEEVLDDYSLFTGIAELNKGNFTNMPDTVAMFMGEDMPRLLEHCRTGSGRVSTAAVTREFLELVGNINAGKK